MRRDSRQIVILLLLAAVLTVGCSALSLHPESSATEEGNVVTSSSSGREAAPREDERLEACLSQTAALQQQLEACQEAQQLWGLEGVQWLARPDFNQRTQYGDFWFFGVDGDIEVCEGNRECTSIPEDSGVCDEPTGCARLSFEFRGFDGSRAIFWSQQSVATAWTPFPKVMTFDMETRQWNREANSMSLTEPVDFGWMVGYADGGVHTELSELELDNATVSMKLHDASDVKAGGSFRPDWMHTEYSVLDNALKVVSHRTRLGPQMEQFEQNTAANPFVDHIRIEENIDAQQVTTLIGLEAATVFWVTFKRVDEETVVLQWHLE